MIKPALGTRAALIIKIIIVIIINKTKFISFIILFYFEYILFVDDEGLFVYQEKVASAG